MGLVLGLVPKKEYKVYSVLLSQSGTNNPTATILENDIGAVDWRWEDTGVYSGTLANSFPANKTFLYIQDLSAIDGKRATCYRFDNNQVFVQTTEVNGTQLDGELINTAFEIRVYY